MLGETLVEMLAYVVGVIPGAFVKWIFSGFKRPIKAIILEDDAISTGFIGFAFIGLVIVILNSLFHFI